MVLEDSLDDMIEENKIPTHLKEDIMSQFDKSINEALNNQTKLKVTIKGHLKTYRFIDNVYLFLLKDTKFKVYDQELEFDHVKVVACDSGTKTSVDKTKSKKDGKKSTTQKYTDEAEK
jgi:transcription initiation factor TFIIA small subunit